MRIYWGFYPNFKSGQLELLVSLLAGIISILNTTTKFLSLGTEMCEQTDQDQYKVVQD